MLQAFVIKHALLNNYLVNYYSKVRGYLIKKGKLLI